MGFLDKLMFWKKKDEFENIGLGEKGTPTGLDLGLGPDLGAGTDLGQGLSMQPPGSQPSMQQPSLQQPPQQPSFSAPNMQPQAQNQDYTTNKNLEVISSKLDALRASLDSINQRLANLERIAGGEEQQRYRKKW